MNEKAQKMIVWTQLREEGTVTRNWCLAKGITRLGAIICLLKKEKKVEIEGKYLPKTTGKRDYAYAIDLEKQPKRIKYMTFREVDGVRVATPVWTS